MSWWVRVLGERVPGPWDQAGTAGICPVENHELCRESQRQTPPSPTPPLSTAPEQSRVSVSLIHHLSKFQVPSTRQALWTSQKPVEPSFLLYSPWGGVDFACLSPCLLTSPLSSIRRPSLRASPSTAGLPDPQTSTCTLSCTIPSSHIHNLSWLTHKQVPACFRTPSSFIQQPSLTLEMALVSSSQPPDLLSVAPGAAVHVCPSLSSDRCVVLPCRPFLVSCMQVSSSTLFSAFCLRLTRTCCPCLWSWG